MTSTQTKLTFAKRILGALTTLVLVACGGGGGGAGSGGGFLPDNNGTPTPSYTLTVSGKNAAGTATNEFSASSPLTIEVLVQDTSTNTASVVSGAVVELQSTLGTITPANASALTNAAGIAEFTLSFNQEEGAGTVTASYVVDGTTYSANFNVQSIVEPLNEPVITLSLAAANSTGDTVTTLSQRSPATLTASFLSTLDGVATPISGELVTINTNVGDVSPSNNTALTDANGDAVFTVSFNGTEGAGSVSVTASLAGVAYTDTLNLQAQDTGAPYEISIQIVNDSDVQTNVLSASQSLTVLASVRRIDGGLFIPVGAGESVQLTTTLGSIAGNGSALTNAQGIASFDLTFDGTVGAGSVTASYDSADGAVSKISNIQSVATAIGYSLDLVAIPSAGMDANTFAQGASIILRATLSSPTSSVANQAVTLITDVGQVSPANGVTLTDANGVAIFEVAFNDVIGAGVATATFNPIGGAIVTSVNLEAVVADPTAGLEVSTFADDGSVTTEFAVGSPMTVRVQLTDGVGAAALKAGEIIGLSSTIGTLDAASKLTNSNGVATFELNSAGVVGAGTLEATYQTDLGLVRAQQTVQSVSTTPYIITVTAAGGPMTLGQDITLTVNLEQPNGTPAVGEIVTLQSTVGSLNKTSALTDGLGDAVFVLSYADQIGAGIVTASFNSGTEVFSNTATVEAVAPAGPTVSLATTVGGVASTQFDASSDMAVVVTVAGSADYTVSAGDTVSLASTIGTVAGNGTALLVDNAGNLEATFTVSSDGTVGVGTLTASIDVGGTVFDANKGIESLGAPYELSAVTFVDSTSAALANAILSSVAPYRSITASVTLTDLSGVALQNRLIQFVSAKGQLTPIDGYVLTDATGVAEATIAYTDDIISGVGELSASYVSALGTVSVVADVQAIAPDLLIGAIDGINFTQGDIASTPASGSLVNQGSAVLQLDIVNAGLNIANASDADRIKSIQSIAFSSFCLDNGLSTLSPGSPITTSSGQLSATYTAGAGCTGDDEVMATLQFGGSAAAQTASQVLTIAAAVEAVSIEVVDVTPTTLAIAGTGALSNISETAVAQFRVVDGNGSPVQGETVNFSLSSTVGGLTLSVVSAISGADGLVSVTLNSGNVPTSTLITAELDSTGQLISSALVTVSTAIPDQNSFTIFSDNLSVSQAYPAVNQTSNISVRLADRYNNVVPDGSVVYFTTEYGAIDASCSIVAGECSVVWRSQAPKPIGSNLLTVDCPDYDNDGDGTANNDAVGTFDPCPTSSLTGIEQGSRTTILATTTGEESFLDVDGDGLMSDFLNEFIDAQHDLGEPYLDANEDGAYQINEFFVDDDSSGSREDGDNLYTGIGCTAATLTSGECTGTTLSVFDNIALILSPSDNLYIAMVDTATAPDSLVQNGGNVAAGSYVAYFSDQYNNQPANGATITVSATGDCSIVSPTTFTVPNNNAANAYRIGIEIASVAATAGADTVSVSIANPGAATVTQTFTCIP